MTRPEWCSESAWEAAEAAFDAMRLTQPPMIQRPSTVDAELERAVSAIAGAIMEAEARERERAEKLWDILDGIDSLPDMLHPQTDADYAKMAKMILKRVEKRHEILTPDAEGQKLLVPDATAIRQRSES